MLKASLLLDGKTIGVDGKDFAEGIGDEKLTQFLGFMEVMKLKAEGKPYVFTIESDDTVFKVYSKEKIVEPELKVEYANLLIDIIRGKDVERFFKSYDRLVEIDYILKQKGLRTVITVSSEALEHIS